MQNTTQLTQSGSPHRELEGARKPITYASVCSGIEAATVAWHTLGFSPVWFSEIEPFPCKVLKHHYPDVPNLGDMTRLKEHAIYNDTTFDVLVGGTPCQSFSIAGLRGGLDDERGNLALEYCRILMAKQPRWFVWENVPGVFSSFSNGATCEVSYNGDGVREETIEQSSDFATLLAAFQECGYSCAWRILDAQHFGVPQRRRRVFVIGHIGNDWRPPYAVLFEPDSLRRDFTPCKKTRKETAPATGGGADSTGANDFVADTLSVGANQTTGFTGDVETTSPVKEEMLPQVDCTEGGISAAVTKKWSKSSGGPSGDEHYNLITQEKKWPPDVAPTIDKTFAKNWGQENQHIEGGAGLFTSHNAFNFEMYSGECPEISPTLQKDRAKDTRVYPSPSEDLPAVTYCLVGNLEGRKDENGPNGSGIKRETRFALNTTDKHSVVIFKEREGCDGGGKGLLSDSETSFTVARVNDQKVLMPPLRYGPSNQDTMHFEDGQLNTLPKGAHSNAGHFTKTFCNSIARRLTPLECERLQGFPDNYTNIPGAKDGPRYASIGNSMAVPVMAWIGGRIDKVDKILFSIQQSKISNPK